MKNVCYLFFSKNKRGSELLVKVHTRTDVKEHFFLAFIIAKISNIVDLEKIEILPGKGTKAWVIVLDGLPENFSHITFIDENWTPQAEAEGKKYIYNYKLRKWSLKKIPQILQP